MNLESLAYQLAKIMHKNQVDKQGVSYFEHIKSVAKLVTPSSTEYVITAYLHDIVEDTNLTLEDLALLGFPASIIGAVDAISRRSDESYWDYIQRCGDNLIARRVKIADLHHNSDIIRFKNSGMPEWKLKRYQRALKYLEEL